MLDIIDIEFIQKKLIVALKLYKKSPLGAVHKLRKGE